MLKKKFGCRDGKLWRLAEGRRRLRWCSRPDSMAKWLSVTLTQKPRIRLSRFGQKVESWL